MRYQNAMENVAAWMLAHGTVKSDIQRSNEYTGVRVAEVTWRGRLFRITQVDGMTCSIEQILVTEDGFGRQQSYTIRKKIPDGFFVWNIGYHMGDDEYIPIAAMNGEFSIDVSTVSAIHMSKEEVQVLRRAAGWGITTLKKARKTAARLTAKPGKSPFMRDLAMNAATILARYSE